jgi:RNA polymerase sigma-70 factor
MLKKGKNTEAKAVFEILVRENQAMLMTYLRAVVRDQSVVDDLFQETMLVVWQKLDDYDHSRPFGSWLRGIAAKLVMAHFRKAKSDIMILESETLEYLSCQLQHISERPGDTWDEKIAALKQCIELLPEDYRRAINLRYFEQHSAQQVAAATQAAVETIKKRLQRARAQLFNCLQRKEVVMETTT